MTDDKTEESEIDEDGATTVAGTAHRPKKEETLTSNLEAVNDQADVPFSLPHVSELEATPRDARQEAAS